MTDKIPSLKERLSKYTTKPSALAHPVLTLLYGQAGSGKTHLAATVSNLPHVKSVLYLDTEGSTTGALHGFDDSKFEIIVIPEVIKALNESGNTVTEIQFLDSILKDLFTNGSEYDAVVLDTLDVAQDWKIKERQGINGTKGDAAFATWREVADWTDGVGRGLKGLGKTSVVVLHDREDKTDSGSLIKRLRLGGSSKDTFAGIPDAVAYLTRKVYNVDGEEREVTIAEFGSQEGKVTKNRFGFPPSLIDPNFPKMWEHINNRQKENN